MRRSRRWVRPLAWALIAFAAAGVLWLLDPARAGAAQAPLPAAAVAGAPS